MAEIMGYTRTVCENECYEAKLAYSMHLAIKTEKESFTPFNHNSGVLFAKATENPDGSLNAKSLKSPWLFKQKDGVGAVPGFFIGLGGSLIGGIIGEELGKGIDKWWENNHKPYSCDNPNDPPCRYNSQTGIFECSVSY